MSPVGHAVLGWCVAHVAARRGWQVNILGFVLGSVVPDTDFVTLVPLIGRMKGHRTITHAPAFQLLLAWILRRMGFWSVFGGQVIHSLVDNLWGGDPPGIAWVWPLWGKRIQVGLELGFRSAGSSKPTV